jgi:hypothetical protein
VAAACGINMKKNCGNCLYGKRVNKSKVIVCSDTTIVQTRWADDVACERWKELKKKLFKFGGTNEYTK